MMILILAADGSWWARYTPYLYLLPISNIIFLIRYKKKRGKAIGIILICLLIVNMGLIGYGNLSINLKKNEITHGFMKQALKETNNSSKLNITIFKNYEGVKYNFDDVIKDKTKINYIEKKEGTPFLFFLQK